MEACVAAVPCGIGCERLFSSRGMSCLVALLRVAFTQQGAGLGARATAHTSLPTLGCWSPPRTPPRLCASYLQCVNNPHIAVCGWSAVAATSRCGMTTGGGVLTLGCAGSIINPAWELVMWWCCTLRRLWGILDEKQWLRLQPQLTRHRTLLLAGNGNHSSSRRSSGPMELRCCLAPCLLSCAGAWPAIWRYQAPVPVVHGGAAAPRGCGGHVCCVVVAPHACCCCKQCL